MKLTPIEFPGTNAVYGKGQPEYIPLPARKTKGGAVTTCWQIPAESMSEIVAEMNHSGPAPVDIFITTLTGNQPLQPLLVTTEAPPDCFEPVTKPLLAENKHQFADVAHERSLSKGFVFAMDGESLKEEGKTVVHFVRLDTHVYDASAPASGLEPMSPAADRRLVHLADCFTAPQHKAVLQLLQVISVNRVALETLIKSGVKLPVPLVPVVRNALNLCYKAGEVYGAT